MDKITLVQKVADLAEYLKMSYNGELPLVVRLSDIDETLEKREFAYYPFARLYCNGYARDGEFAHYFLNEDCLREAIEKKEIFVPVFIDLEGKEKYVDYITNSRSNDWGSHIVFRDTKRFFKGAQARDSIQKNQPHAEYVKMQCGGYSGFVPMIGRRCHNEDSEELFSLCTSAFYHFRDKKKKAAPQKKIQAS